MMQAFMTGGRIALAVLLAGATLLTVPATADDLEPEKIQKIEEALPQEPYVKVDTPRKVLIFSKTAGFRHSSIPYGHQALQRMGETTQAYTAVSSEDDAMFSPENLNQFDAVIMLNTTMTLFEDPVKQQALLDFVHGGKGIVGIHAATDCFYDWADYGAMMGGYFDGHPWGADSTVTVKLDDPAHPINQVFKGQGFSITDEIYQFRPEPYSREKLRVLLSLDTEKTDMTKDGIKRTDGDFAVSWVQKYGDGRVYYCSLGHNDHIYWDPRILHAYLAGIQFALGDLEADATPTAQVSAEYFKQSGDELIRRIVGDVTGEAAHYNVGDDPSSLVYLTDAVIDSHGNPDRQAALGDALAKLAANEDATFAAREFACKQLYRAGGGGQVATLAPLLTNETMSDNARYALEGIQAPEATSALVDALGSTEGALRVGVLNSLGQKYDVNAVAAIVPFVSSDDADTAAAAIAALGSIGGEEAQAALKTAMESASDSVRCGALDDAYMHVADNFRWHGESDKAADMYATILSTSGDSVQRLAALRGMIVAKGEAASETILSALQCDDAAVRDTAAAALREVDDEGLTKILVQYLPGVSPEAQTLIIEALADRDAKSAGPVLTDLARTAEGAVKSAALRALVNTGGADAVPVLAAAAASSDGDVAFNARQSLHRLAGAGVDEVIAAEAGAAQGQVKNELLAALGARHARNALPVLLLAAADEDAGARAAAHEALAVVASSDDLPALAVLLSKEPEAAVRSAAEGAYIATAERSGPSTDSARILVGLLPGVQQNEQATASFVKILGELGDASALPALEAAARDGRASVEAAALTALSQWPTGAPADVLYNIANEATDATRRTLALRGLFQLLGQPSDRGAAETLARYEDGLALADSAELKKLAISGLANVRDPRVLDVLSKLREDPELAADASAAIATFESVGFEVTASSNAGDAGKAIDQDPGTRWTTGESQKAGQWFTIDLGWERALNKLVLDAATSQGDYPRGYEVYVSSDGENWGTPVAQGEGSAPLLEVPLQGKTGRFVKIVQTGSVGLFWSIHELRVEAT
ncbi:MAG: ThuA domain-containing protein [Candidatus Hydrogenedentes bacterium]|nr:ThuA domain-containing protein [Candidatus Hydrogenedentota bacterium]